MCDDSSTLVTTVFLATAHLDPDAGNGDASNLKALRHRCPMLNGREEHGRRLRMIYLSCKASGDLFLGHDRG